MKIENDNDKMMKMTLLKDYFMIHISLFIYEKFQITVPRIPT